MVWLMLSACVVVRYLYAGCADGNVLIYDIRMGIDTPAQVVEQAQKGKIRNVAVRGSSLVTCGMTDAESIDYRTLYRRHGQHLVDADGEAADAFVNVFDTRMVQVGGTMVTVEPNVVVFRG